MAIFYLDTSALVKRYKTEEGSEMVDNLYDNLPSGNSLAIFFFDRFRICFCHRETIEGRDYIG